MRFDQYEYQRPSIESLQQQFTSSLEQFNKAKTAKEQEAIIREIDNIRTEFISMYNICYIRHTTNTTNAFYEQENQYFNEQLPNYEALISQYYQALVNSSFQKELETTFGKQLFTIANLRLKTFKPDILEDLQEENRLTSEYVKVKATAKLDFEGEEYNLSTIYPLEVDQNRETRRAASTVKWQFYQDKQEQVEAIFSQLVEFRNRIAQKLGFENFIELGYARLVRSDYDANRVAKFRGAVRKYIVPLASKLYERQRLRLGLDRLLFYDEDFYFNSGNPTPKGTPAWIVEQAKTMYEELSKETKTFFNYMLDSGLLELESRAGKATGGYCTFIGKYNSPFIFSNFNGTSADIGVLTHEAGHAFQVYESRNSALTEYLWPTFEAAEIHSMSMEFFTWPWMQLFFKEDTEKYKFSHLANAVCFIPYGVAVDAFQHYVYEHPEATPAERNQAWRDLERTYLPHRIYDSNKFLEKGGFWQKQSHIFTNPFYYIDYTLAQICAFQFWIKDQSSHESAWSDYWNLCKAGGSEPFLNLVEKAKLNSPFEEPCIETVVQKVESWLEGVDDTAF